MHRIKHGFGFGMVSNTVLRDPELTLREKALYSYLCTYADADTNELFVSIYRIAAECDIGYSTAKRILNQLYKKGIITRERRGAGQSFKTILLK